MANRIDSGTAASVRASAVDSSGSSGWLLCGGPPTSRKVSEEETLGKMIRQPTVLILGAGASAPFGFSLGSTLSEQIQRGNLDDDSMFAQDLCSAGVPPDYLKLGYVRQFAAELRAAARYSIDEFLPQQPGYRQVAKLAIAQTLISQVDGHYDQRLQALHTGREPERD
jgi:hypothetical protein